MNKLYILEQKITTLEIILESLVDELIEEELINPKRLDSRIIERIKELSEKVKEERDVMNLMDFPYWGEKGEA